MKRILTITFRGVHEHHTQITGPKPQDRSTILSVRCAMTVDGKNVHRFTTKVSRHRGLPTFPGPFEIDPELRGYDGPFPYHEFCEAIETFLQAAGVLNNLCLPVNSIMHGNIYATPEVRYRFEMSEFAIDMCAETIEELSSVVLDRTSKPKPAIDSIEIPVELQNNANESADTASSTARTDRDND